MNKFLGAIALFAVMSTVQPAEAQYPYEYQYPQQYPVQQQQTPYWQQPRPWQQQQQNSNYYINNNQYQNQNRTVQVSVNSPTNGSSFRGNFQLAGTGTPGAQVIVQGNRQAQTVVNGNGQWRIPMTLGGMAPGTVIHLTVFGRDQFGNQSNSTQLKYAVSY